MIHPLRARVSRVAAAALAAAGFCASSAWAEPACKQVGDTLQLKPSPGIYNTTSRVQNMCYADGASWQEVPYGGTTNTTYYQTFEFYRSNAWTQGQKVPLIIWSHPTGPTQVVVKDDCAATGCPYGDRVLMPAINSGYALMSIQFRHPRASQPADHIDLNVPNTDIANAVQWARQNADKLGIDADNIFLLGQSRGTLALLTAFMKDQKVDNAPDWRSKSSHVNAVFGVQAQTTYEHDELRDLFITPKKTDKVPGYPTFYYRPYLDKADPAFVNPGSALAEVQLTDPPFWLRYERWPTDDVGDNILFLGSRVAPLGQDIMKDGTCYEDNNPNYPGTDDTGCLDVHHPNFGVALMNKYKSLGPTQDQLSKVGVQYGKHQATPTMLNKVAAHFFDNYTCFFIQNMTPAGEALREQATPPGVVVKCSITDQPWPPAKL